MSTERYAVDIVQIVETMTRIAPIEVLREIVHRDPTPELAAFIAYWEALDEIPLDDCEEDHAC